MIHYTGWPNIVAGVPARDLSKEEWAALTDDQRSDAAPFYRPAGPAPEPPTPPTVTTKPASSAGSSIKE